MKPPLRYLLRPLFLIILVFVTILVSAKAQESQSQKPYIAQPTAEQKARLTALASESRSKDLEAELAKARAETARQRFFSELALIFADLGLKPSETSISWNDKGEPVFSRVETAKAPPANSVPPVKPEAKP